MAKKRLVTAVDEDVYSLINEQSKSRGLSVYVFAGDLLTKASLNTEKHAADQLLAPHIRMAVQQELTRMSDQIIEMLVRIYMEGGTSRRLTQLLLAQTGGLDSNSVGSAMQIAWDNTYADMSVSLAGLTGWKAKVTKNSLLRVEPGQQAE